MSHQTFREELLDLAYGELGKRAARRVEAHLEGCAECRAELARIRETRAAMAALPLEPAPEAGEAILLAAAREAARGRERPAPLLPRWLWASSATAVAVAAVVAVSYRILSLRPGPLGREDSQALLGSGPSESALQPETEARPQAGAPAEQEGAKADAPAEQEGARAGAPAEQEGAGARAPAPAAAEKRRRPPAEQRPGRAPAREPRRLAREESPPEPARPAAPAPPPRARAPVPPTAAQEPSGEGEIPSAAPYARSSGASGYATAPPQRAEAKGLSADLERSGEARSSAALRDAAPGVREEAASATENAAGDAVARHAQLRAAGRLRAATASFPGCPGESWRRVESDPRGRVVKYTRRGRAEGVPFEVELFYGSDGMLRAARYREGEGPANLVQLPEPGSAAGAAGAVPRAVLDPPRAEEAALDAPARCRL